MSGVVGDAGRGDQVVAGVVDRIDDLHSVTGVAKAIPCLILYEIPDFDLGQGRCRSNDREKNEELHVAPF